MISFKQFAELMETDQIDEVFGKFFGKAPTNDQKTFLQKKRDELEAKKAGKKTPEQERKEKDEKWNNARRNTGQNTSPGRRDDYALHRQYD